MSASQAWRTSAWAEPTTTWATIVGPWSVLSRRGGPRGGAALGSASARHDLPAVISRVWLAWCLTELGTFAEGALGEEALRIAEAVDHPGSLIDGLLGCRLLYLRQGDLHQAIPLLERAWPSARTRTSRLFPQYRCGLGRGVCPGWAYRRGPAAAGAGDGTGALRRNAVYQALWRLALGEAYLLAGHLEEAQRPRRAGPRACP